MSFKKVFAFLMVLPVFMISWEVLARGKGSGGGARGHSHEVHGKSHHGENDAQHESKKSEENKKHFAEASKRQADNIAKQNERKLADLDAWKTKRIEKCAGDQKCLDRAEKIYSKRKEQIDKQHEARLRALAEFNKKHELEGTESGETTEPTETESPEKSKSPETPEAPEKSTE